MSRYFVLLCLSLACGNFLHAAKITDFYEIENVQAPELLVQRYGSSKGGQGRRQMGWILCLTGGWLLVSWAERYLRSIQKPENGNCLPMVCILPLGSLP